MIRVGVDIGGTFTDFVVFDESGSTFQTFKVFSTPQQPAEAVLEGLSRVVGDESPRVIHGSTVATNAVLERKGARTALVTTQGFRDILTIGRQNRESIYDLFADRPEPLVPPERCFEVEERVDYRGEVLVALNREAIQPLIEQLEAQAVESVAVSLLFSFLYPEHERLLGEALSEAGFNVSRSSEILPEFREYERTSTTVINAFVAPVMDRYLGQLEERLPGDKLRIMQSNGGTIQAVQARRHAVRSILSGPAGGVVGASHVARAAGLDRVISFDMGGTSTDVSLMEGEIRITSEAEVGGLPIRVPVADIHTVGSGGGSIAYGDSGGALRVGPQSAGVDPGPVCYGRGGLLPTVTDANLALGRLASDYFLGGEVSLDVGAATHALAELGRSLGISPRPGLTLAQTTALGVVEVANVQMTRALRTISVERGFDPRDFALLSYGGAGGLHARDLASGLGMRRVLIPSIASTLSAFGMLVANVVKDYVQTVMLPGDTPYDGVLRRLEGFEAQARQEMAYEGVRPDEVTLYKEVDIRYRGQAYELTVPLTENFAGAFHQLHEQTYGYYDAEQDLEVVNVRLKVVGSVPSPSLPEMAVGEADPSEALYGERPVVLRSNERDGAVSLERVRFYLGEKLRPGHVISGPAVIMLDDTTIFVAGGDEAIVDSYLNVIIELP